MSLHKKHIVLADGSAKPTASVKASVSFGRPQNAEADDRAEAKAAKVRGTPAFDHASRS